jgi:hypothetical protein
MVPIDNFGMSTKTTEQFLKNCFGGSYIKQKEAMVRMMVFYF